MLSYEHLEEIDQALCADKDVFWINEGTATRIDRVAEMWSLTPYLTGTNGYLDTNNVSPRDIFIGRRLEN